MKAGKIIFIFCLLSTMVMAMPISASDMRALQLEARQTRDELSRRADRQKSEAEKAQLESRNRITEDRVALQREIARISGFNDGLSTDIGQLEKKSNELEDQEKQLRERRDEIDATVHELVGVIRSNAKDLGGLVEQNGQTKLVHDHYSILLTIAENANFPSMKEVETLHEAVLEQIRMTGEVSLQQTTIIDRAGLEASAEVLFAGPFTAMYRRGDETGFLQYSYSGNSLYALSHFPPRSMQKEINRYMSGSQDNVPMDISRGAALRQLSYRKNLVDQIGGGGPIVWPILAILAGGLLIVLERFVTLACKHHRNVPVFEKVKAMIRKNDWIGCEQTCREYEKKPIARVLRAGISSHDLPREDMENVLQEAILREIPVLERSLSTLGMLVGIAPLLGLLGTVTGMINVFHVITLNGTGDPRLMSGGISEALVTTMLGLGVAIPLMLLHNVLTRTVDRMVAEMEEKSVALVNLIHKQRNPA